MTYDESLDFCIQALETESGQRFQDGLSKEDRLRALMNVTLPLHLSDDFYAAQDAVLQEQMKKKGTVHADSLPLSLPGVSLWRGDITRLDSDAIVNACNEQLLGCFGPLHLCVDNAIHSAAGLEVRRDLIPIMKAQNYFEPNGGCKVTSGYNLPSRYIFHTVGPKVFGVLRRSEKMDLRSCYESCLANAEEMGLHSIAFCSISTGVYGFPIKEAAKIAVDACLDFLSGAKSVKRVIFDVYSEKDYGIYDRILKERA